MAKAALTVADGLRLAAARPLQQLRHNLKKLPAGDGVAAVHDARVALRRLGALLRATRPFVSQAELGALKSDMRWLRRSLGAVRDLDVLTIDVVPLLRGALPNDGAIDALVVAAERRRGPELAALIAGVDSERCRHFVSRLAALFDDGARETMQQPFDAFAAKLLRQRYRKLRKMARKIGELDDARLHRLRIRLRTLRYLYDCFAVVLPTRRYADFRRATVELQDHLGALNDAASAPRLVDSLAAENDDAALARGAGLVTGWSSARRDGLRAALKAPWRKFVRDGDRLFEALEP